MRTVTHSLHFNKIKSLSVDYYIIFHNFKIF